MWVLLTYMGKKIVWPSILCAYNKNSPRTPKAASTVCQVTTELRYEHVKAASHDDIDEKQQTRHSTNFQLKVYCACATTSLCDDTTWETEKHTSWMKLTIYWQHLSWKMHSECNRKTEGSQQDGDFSDQTKKTSVGANILTPLLLKTCLQGPDIRSQVPQLPFPFLLQTVGQSCWWYIFGMNTSEMVVVTDP